jgi:phage terminase large subunit
LSEQRVKIRLKLTKPQEDFIFSEAIHPAMVAGYGAGKSQAAVIRLALLALKYDGLSFGFVEPTYDLIRLIAFPRFQEILDEWGVKYNLNKADAIIKLENNSQIIFRSADNPERLVGFQLADAVIDEADTLRVDQAKLVWTKMLGRIRERKPDNSPNTLAAVSTPEGFAFMYDMWGKEPREGYELIKAPTSSNPYLPDGYIKQLEATYSSAQLSAYLDGNFVNLNAGSVYHEFDRKLNSSIEIINSDDVLHVGLDFNVSNMSAVIHVLRGDSVHVVNELTGVFDTPTMARLLKEKYPSHRILIYPDASGNARKSNNASESDHSILRSYGLQVLVNSRNPFIKDRVLSVNAMIHNLGARRYFVNAQYCPSLVESLEKQCYAKTGEPDKAGGFDHVVDATGYFIAYRYPLVNNRPTFAAITGI